VQHGLGILIDSKKSTMRYGLWENGKRKRWFDKSEITEIEEGTFDIGAEFSNPSSIHRVDKQPLFSRPVNFD
jgi:hypothetical protein